VEGSVRPLRTGTPDTPAKARRGAGRPGSPAHEIPSRTFRNRGPTDAVSLEEDAPGCGRQA
jgi:hypothetical protein